MNCPLSRTSANRASSSARTGAHWALTSTRGICCTATHFSGVDQIRHHHENACNDCILDVAESVVRMRVRGAERPAGGAEDDREDCAADDRKEEELHERDADDSGGNRDEGAEKR